MTHQELIINIDRQTNEVSKAKQDVYALRNDLESTNERFYEALDSYIHDGNPTTKDYMERKRKESRKLEEEIEAGLIQVAHQNVILQNMKNDYANKYSQEGAKPNMTQAERTRLSRKLTY